MANLFHTVGVDQFQCLSCNIIKSFHTKLNGGTFQLDFGPLLQQNKTQDKPKSDKAKSTTSTTSTTPTLMPEAAPKANTQTRQMIKEKQAKPKRVLHSHGAYISCNECDACPIRGARYVCMITENYNLCEDCEARLMENDEMEHPMIKVYQPRSNWHIKNFKGLQDLVAIPDTQHSEREPEPEPEPQPQPQPEPEYQLEQALQSTVSIGSSAKPEEQEPQPHPAIPRTIPLASIMPSIAKATHSATTKNQSLMDEIDALLAPTTATSKTNAPSGLDRLATNRDQDNANVGSGLDRLAFGAMPSMSNADPNRTKQGDAMSGLIDLVTDHRKNKADDNGNVKEYDAFVCDTQHPGDIGTNASATMTWSIKNTGYKSFGDHCKLAFVSGDGLLVSQYQIPNALPHDTVRVTMSFNAFSTPGTYETNFRLCCNGKQFGPQLIVKINVIDPRISNVMPNPSSVRPLQPRQPPMQPVPPRHIQRMQPVQPPMQPRQPQMQSRQPPMQPVRPPTQPPVRQPLPSTQQPPHYAPWQQPQTQYTTPNMNYYPQQPPQALQPLRKPQPQPQPQPQPKPIKAPSPKMQPLTQPQPQPRAEPVRSGPSFNEATSLFPSAGDVKEENKDTKGGWFGWGKKKAPTKKESNLKCLCGATLMYLDVKEAYKGKKVYCDICSTVCKQCIFHCPSGDIKSHPGGFDLCYACGGSQLSKQPNPSPNDMYLTTDSGLGVSSSYPALKPSAPPGPSSPIKKSSNYDQDFVYPSQLKQLLDMGFDKDKARRLLLKNRGNMSQVLAELIK
eukprot:236927_1